MQKFLDSFKKHKNVYIVILSLITTIILINEIFDFTERILNNYLILLFSSIIFLFLIYTSIKRRFWENEE